MSKIKKIGQLSLVLLVVIMLAGCSIVLQKRHPRDIQRIRELKEEARALADAKRILQERLRREIGEEKVRLELTERGLVITFVAEVLFDSGRAEIKEEAYPVLDKVARIFTDELKDQNLSIEGHTDNEPIKHSPWRSNWELSTGRATSVLHYLVDKKGIRPERVSATGYGEFRPVASNATAEGRQRNRRVEIVVMPERIERVGLEEPYREEPKPRHRK